MTVKSSITGRFTTALDAVLHPETTYTVKPPRPSAGKVKCPTCRGSGYVPVEHVADAVPAHAPAD